MSSRNIQRIRVILGFLMATALPGLLLAIILTLGPTHVPKLELMARIMKGSLAITIPPVVVVAIPLYLWLSRSGRLRLYWVALVGAVTGATWGLFQMVAYASWRISNGQPPAEIWRNVLAWLDPQFAVLTLIAVLMGIISAVVGWLIIFGPHVAPRTEA